MHSQRRVGVILGYVNILVKNAVNLLYTPMLLSFVGKGDYGVFQTANSFVFSLTLLSFGFSGAYVRFYTQREAEGDEAGIRVLNGMYLLLYIGICLLTLVLGFIGAANVHVLFSESFTAGEVGLARTLMAIMTLNIATTLLSTVFDANVVVHEKFVFQQTRQLLTTLATPVAAFILLILGMGAAGIAAAQLCVNFVLLVLNIRYATLKLRMRFDISRFDIPLFRSIAAFSAWIFINQVCDLVNQNVPNVVLGAICGAEVVAVFSVAVQIRNLFISLSTTLSGVFVPTVNRVVAESGDDEELSYVMTRVGRYQAILLCWVYGGFSLLGRFFVEHWAGDGFSDAYLLLLFMTLPLLIPLCQNVGIEIQKAKNMHYARSLVYLFMAILSTVFTVVASPSLSWWAPAIAYIASITLGNCLFMNWYYQVKVGLNMRLFWKRVIPAFVCMIIASGTGLVGTRFLPVDNWIAFLVWGFAYSAVYVMLIWRFMLDKEERKKIRSLAGRAPER